MLEAKAISQAPAATLTSLVDKARASMVVREHKTGPIADDEIILQGTKHKRQILQAYKDTFGAQYTDSIVTKKKGKHSCRVPEQQIIRMRPNITKYYRVQELTIYNVITTVIR